MRHILKIKERWHHSDIVDKPKYKIKEGDIVEVGDDLYTVKSTGNHAAENCKRCCIGTPTPNRACLSWITRNGYLRCPLTYRYPTTHRRILYFVDLNNELEVL